MEKVKSEEKLIIANWKMNPPTLPEAERLFEAVKHGIKDIKGVDIVICPPFVYLSDLMKASARGGLAFGSQDCFWEQEGAFTGEISPAMLKDLGCKYVIIGHSERRQYFGETDEMIAKKLKAAIGAGLKPILCIGETLKQREQGKVNEVLKKQLHGALKGCQSSMVNPAPFVTNKRCGVNSQSSIAYEPVWAIGTGIPCDPKQAAAAHQFIRQELKLLVEAEETRISTQKNAENIRVNPRVACPASKRSFWCGDPREPRTFSEEKVRGESASIIYGGSVDSKNIESFLKEPEIDGALVGGASLKAREFIKIVKIANKTRNS